MKQINKKAIAWDTYGFVGVFSLLATVAIYRFGQSNHAIIIPFLKDALNGNLYPNDYLISEQQNYFTLLWPAVGYVIDLFGFEISTVFFVIYLFSICFAMYGVYLFCTLLFDRDEVAYLAMFLIVFAFLNNPGLGGDYLLESRLKESVVALPFFIFALYFFFKKDYLRSYLLQGVAFLIHPLSAIHLISVLFLPFLIKFREIGPKLFFTCLTVMVLIISPLLYIKFTTSTGPGLFYADPHWIELIKIRQPEHVFPSLWSGWRYLKALVLMVAFWVSWRYKPSYEYHSVIKAALVAIAILWIAGAVFAEFYPLAIVVQLQLFRSYIILTFFAILYFSNYFITVMRSSDHLIRKIGIVVLMLAFVYNFPQWKNKYAYFVAIGILLVSYPLVFKRNMPPLILKASLLFFLGSFITYEFVNDRPFTIEVRQDKDWGAVQLWAKDNTDINDVFITPPAIEGFRIQSERSIYGDWKDGQQAYFNPEFGYEWEKRMNALGMNNLYKCKENPHILEDNFRKLSMDRMDTIARDIRMNGHKVYLVTYADVALKNFSRMYQNTNFAVYLVP